MPRTWGFPGGPVVKTLPSKAGGVDSLPGLGARSLMPQDQKTENRSNIVTTTIKTLKKTKQNKKTVLELGTIQTQCNC